MQQDCSRGPPSSPSYPTLSWTLILMSSCEAHAPQLQHSTNDSASGAAAKACAPHLPHEPHDPHELMWSVCISGAAHVECVHLWYSSCAVCA
mmetsp:Transcript_5310/g.14267  ORF Transcript_5310/g.14267 Transcript_5310/m.14267 type:complete len:92 (-) Transcript_5310:13-288(-)